MRTRDEMLASRRTKEKLLALALERGATPEGQLTALLYLASCEDQQDVRKVASTRWWLRPECGEGFSSLPDGCPLVEGLRARIKDPGGMIDLHVVHDSPEEAAADMEDSSSRVVLKLRTTPGANGMLCCVFVAFSPPYRRGRGGRKGKEGIQCFIGGKLVETNTSPVYTDGAFSNFGERFYLVCPAEALRVSDDWTVAPRTPVLIREEWSRFQGDSDLYWVWNCLTFAEEYVTGPGACDNNHRLRAFEALGEIIGRLTPPDGAEPDWDERAAVRDELVSFVVNVRAECLELRDDTKFDVWER